MLLLWVVPFCLRKTVTSAQINGINSSSKPKTGEKKYSILAIFIIQCFWDTLLTTSLSPRSLIPALRSTQHGVAASGPQNHVPETHQMVSRDGNSSLELQNNPQVIPKF